MNNVNKRAALKIILKCSCEKKKSWAARLAEKALCFESENRILYCICRDVDYGEMVCCDNQNCKVGWFHFKCVKLTVSPVGQWFCDSCKK